MPANSKLYAPNLVRFEQIQHFFEKKNGVGKLRLSHVHDKFMWLFVSAYVVIRLAMPFSIISLATVFLLITQLLRCSIGIEVYHFTSAF